MIKQVLIVNITRMGDLIQMIPLLKRLDYESPGVAIDVVVDTEFASIARLLPGIRHALAYGFQSMMDDSRVYARDFVALYKDVVAWARPLADTRYDRIINLSFNRRSACLIGYIGSPDVRGLTTAPDGSLVVKNPWLKYFADLHSYRSFNRFNLVDMYALGGSTPGPHFPVALNDELGSRDWANQFLCASGSPENWIAVQVGASDVMKAWRPEYFGQTMARLSERANVGFVLVGTEKELPAAQEAVNHYREAKGKAPVCHAVGKTSIPELIGLLSQSALMISNDTGPMHLAVGVGTPVVNVSVGHVDFRETGPYGHGHWVVQPDIECGPCGFDKVCPHHACKDRVVPDQVAELCLHVLGHQSVPRSFSGVRIYESGVDEDNLGTYRLRAGGETPLHAWYSLFWRVYWYESCTGQKSQLQPHPGPPPDIEHVHEVYHQLMPMLENLCVRGQDIVQITSTRPMPVEKLQSYQTQLNEEMYLAQIIGKECLAFSPITTAFFRDTHNLESTTLEGMAQEYVSAYKTWQFRVSDVGRRLGIQERKSIRRNTYACTA